MTDPDLAQLESAATPGPWEAVPERYLDRGDWGIFAPGGRVVAAVPVHLVLRANEAQRKQFAADAAFIVAVRNELPHLLSELTRLRAIEVAARELSKIELVARRDDISAVTGRRLTAAWDTFTDALAAPTEDKRPERT